MKDRFLKKWGARRPNRRGLGFVSRVFAGCEVREVAAEYRWDGMRRGADPAHPLVVFQATLEGWGVFEDGRGRRVVGPGMAFLAVAPSRHVYFLEQSGAPWSFFYAVIRHDYIARRIGESQRTCEAVWTLGCEHPFWRQSAALWEAVVDEEFSDELAEEGALFEWLMGYERMAQAERFPERARFEERVGRAVMRALPRAVGVEVLAAEFGMSRTQFSHLFKARTGQSPAAFALTLRLREAARLLRATESKVAAIAEACGFADATHLGKAFRRQFRMSPAGFRRHARG